MKRIWFAMMAVLALAVFASGAQAAPTLKLDYAPPGSSTSYNNGGPFEVSNIVGGPANLVGTSFLTFCVEENEYFSPGSSYPFSVADYAFKGGISGQQSLNQDPLSNQSAWLYWEFRNGSIANTLPNEQALQAAIWFLEGEQGSAGIGSQYVLNAQLAVFQGWKNDGSVDGKIVEVLNLYTGTDPNNPDNQAQSQLGLFSVPEPGTLLLLGSGFLAMGFGLRKRFGK